MKHVLPTFLDTLHTLALAIWLGGLVMIGAVVAPAAFHHVPGLTRPQSAMVVGESLRLFGKFVEICALVMIGAQYLLRRRYQRDRARFIGDGVRQLLTFAAFLLAEVCRYNLFPAMDSARETGQHARFDSLHQLYTSLSMAQLVFLVGIVALTAWLQLPRVLVAPVASPSATPAPNPKSKPTPTTRRAAK